LLLYTGLRFNHNNALFSGHTLAQPRELAFLRHKPLLLLIGFIIVSFDR
jgi:hypothetical protein